MKHCGRCGQDLPVEVFRIVQRPKGSGRHAWCRACEAAYARARHQAKRKELLPKLRAYYHRNKEQARERNRAYMAANAERVAARHRAIRAARGDELRRASSKWQKAHPDAVRLYRQRRKTNKLQAFVEDVESLVVLELDDGVCGICGDDVDPTDFQIDHVTPLSRGGEHSYANTQVAHPLCNARKHAHLPE